MRKIYRDDCIHYNVDACRLNTTYAIDMGCSECKYYMRPIESISYKQHVVLSFYKADMIAREHKEGNRNKIAMAALVISIGSFLYSLLR